MFLFILFICLIQAFVKVEGQRVCEDLFPEELEDEIVVDAKLLSSVCPKLITYLDCFEREITKLGLPLTLGFNGTKDVVNSICEEGNKLHEGYVKHFECYQNLYEKWPECYDEGRDAYLEYRMLITSDENDEQEEDEQDDEDSITLNEPHCMMDAFAAACLGDDVLERCGRDAKKTFVELFKRSHILEDFCGEKEEEILRYEYLYYLLFKEYLRSEVLYDMFYP